jgi:hypothetical protein
MNKKEMRKLEAFKVGAVQLEGKKKGGKKQVL